MYTETEHPRPAVSDPVNLFFVSCFVFMIALNLRQLTLGNIVRQVNVDAGFAFSSEYSPSDIGGHRA